MVNVSMCLQKEAANAHPPWHNVFFVNNLSTNVSPQRVRDFLLSRELIRHEKGIGSVGCLKMVNCSIHPECSKSTALEHLFSLHHINNLFLCSDIRGVTAKSRR